MLKQIMEKNMVEYPHSIVLIKNTFVKNSNKYLLYYDQRWDCKLFINYQTVPGPESDNTERIQSTIASELKVKPEGCTFLFQELHTKFSVSAQKEKYYCHRFYKVNIKRFPPEIQKDSFEIEGKNISGCQLPRWKKIQT